MDYNVLCNGKSIAKTASSTNKKESNCGEGRENLSQISNLNWLIHISFTRHDYKYCKAVIDHQFQASYDHEYLYIVKGVIARIEGNLQESLQCMQKAMEINPNNPENLKEMGKTLYALERWKHALEVFMKIDKISQRPDHEVCYYIGELLFKNNEKTNPAVVDEAKEYFHRAIRNGKQLESYYKLAEIYKSENNIPKAIEMLENTLQITTDNIDILTDIGILYLKVNDTKGAFDKLFEVTRKYEYCPKAMLALGAILQSKGDVDGALNKYKLIHSDKEKGVEVWSNVGLCFYKKKKFIAAISCLKKAVWIEPINFNCLLNLGFIFLSSQQYASAFHAFATAICLRSDNAEAYMLLGSKDCIHVVTAVCLKCLGDHGNAFLAFERSTMLPEALKNPLIYLNFAIYCWRMKRLDQASANLNNFFSVASHHNVRYDYKDMGEKLKSILSEEPGNTEVKSIEEVVKSEIHEPNSTDSAAEAATEGDFKDNLI